MRRFVSLAVAVFAAMVPMEATGKEAVTEGDCDRAIRETAHAYKHGRQPEEGTEQLARDCTTIAGVETFTNEDGSGDGEAVTASSVGSGCRSIADGRIYYNGFGQEIVRFVGHLRWCFNRGWTTGGNFWIDVNRCCYWYYEGIVDQGNGGCLSGCTFVSRYRMGSFIFNPPWPAITTRVQPWFRLRGNGDGTATHSSGG